MYNTNQEKAKILFVFISNDYMNCYGTSYHLGTGYIRAYLQAKGIASKQLICKEDVTLPELVELIIADDINLIGFTCYDFNYYLNKLVAQELKKLKPDLTIIFGGPTATFSDDLILNDCPAVDICVRGEGELTVYELIQVWEHGKNLSQVLGISYRRGGMMVRNMNRDLVRGEQKGAELDIIPSPYLSGTIPPAEGVNVGLITSRGCVYRCTYCNFTIMSRYSLRFHSVDRVIAELKKIFMATNHTGRVIEFFDDAFSMKINRAKLICEKIIEEKINDKFFFLCATRANCLNEDLIRLMAKARMGLAMGIESAVPRVLANVKKVRFYSPEPNDKFLPEKKFLKTVQEKVELAKKLGVKPVVVSIILGLPSENYSDGCASVEFIRKLDVTEYAHNILKIYPGTELFDIHSRYGLKIKPSIQLLPYETFHSYDVATVPMLDNAVHLRMWRNQKDQLLGILLGRQCASSGKEDENETKIQLIILDGVSVQEPRSLSWLSQHLPLTARLFVVDDQPNGLNVESTFEQFTQAQVPVTSFNYLIWNKEKNEMETADGSYISLRYGNSAYERTIHDKTPLYFLPFSQSEHFFNLAHKPIEDNALTLEEKGVLVLTVMSKEDMEVLKAMFDKGLKKGVFTLPARVLDYTFFLEDECRWSDRQCPASKLCKVVVENGTVIKPCMTGQVFTRLEKNEPLSTLSNRLEYLHQQEMIARGCNMCPVKDHCSKCLYPYPMNAQAYCKFRRQDFVLNWIGDVFEMLRQFRALCQKHTIVPIAKTILIAISRHNIGDNPPEIGLKPKLYMISIDKQAYLYKADVGHFYRLGETSALIFKALLSGKTYHNVTENIMIKYSCNLMEAKTAANKVIDQFRKMNIFIEHS